MCVVTGRATPMVKKGAVFRAFLSSKGGTDQKRFNPETNGKDWITAAPDQLRGGGRGAVSSRKFEMVVGVVSDLSGDADDLASCGEREFIEVEQDGVNCFVKRIGRRPNRTVPDEICGNENSGISVSLEFESMGHFSPMGMASQIPPSGEFWRRGGGLSTFTPTRKPMTSSEPSSWRCSRRGQAAAASASTRTEQRR